jgi:pSer/pThr/pTyr-binding forkhead associated (FHA) protein
MNSSDRTLTAMVLPSGRPDEAYAAVLLRIGRADAPTPDARTRVLQVGSGITVGRGDGTKAATADELHLDDPWVSTRHARVFRQGSEFIIEDLGSKNGTFLEGRRVDGQQPLPAGGRLFIGHHAFVFRFLSPAELDAV